MSPLVEEVCGREIGHKRLRDDGEGAEELGKDAAEGIEFVDDNTYLLKVDLS